MRPALSLACVVMLSPLPALAQGTPPPPPPTDPATTTPPVPLPPAPPAPLEPVPPGPPPPPPPSTSGDNRPTDPWSLGLGAGWFFPGTDIFVPNTASVRIRYSGVIVEPFLNLSLGGNDSVSETDEPQDGTDSRSDFTGSNYTTALGTTVRVGLFQRGNFDLQFIGTGTASYASSTLAGDTTFGAGTPQDTLTEAATIALSASYGAGIEWFFLENMGMSFDAQNPLATWTRTDSRNVTDVEVFDPVTGETVQDQRVTEDRDSSFNVGAIFAPSVRLMFHLYF